MADKSLDETKKLNQISMQGGTTNSVSGTKRNMQGVIDANSMSASAVDTASVSANDVASNMQNVKKANAMSAANAAASAYSNSAAGQGAVNSISNASYLQETRKLNQKSKQNKGK